MKLKRPKEPLPGDCCGNGCARCVWVVYFDELVAYEAWKAESGEVDSEDSLDEVEESEESSGSYDVEEIQYIGSVVVRLLNIPGNDEVSDDSWVRTIDPSMVPITNVELVTKSISPFSSHENPSTAEEGDVYLINVSTPLPATGISEASASLAKPGDVVEVLVPNNVWPTVGFHSGRDLVLEMSQRLNLRPDQWCELDRSPFVPENNFPPWLPLRKPITIRRLLTFFVDLTTNSFLHPKFFQSLLRLYEGQERNDRLANQKTTSEKKEISMEQHGDAIECLKKCATPDCCLSVIRHLISPAEGEGKVFPSIGSILNIFPFIQVPLDRFLEISTPLRPRKLSVVQQYEVTAEAHNLTPVTRITQLCLRHVFSQCNTALPATRNSSSTVNLSDEEHVVRFFSNALREQIRRSKGGSCFSGHTSDALTAFTPTSQWLHYSHPAKLYLGTSIFSSTSFSRCLSAAVSSCMTSLLAPLTAKRVTRNLWLIGIGTGMAPLMSAVYALLAYRESTTGTFSRKDPFQCAVWYGARNRSELVFHSALQKALGKGAISNYRYALSREEGCQKQYVTELFDGDSAEKQHMKENLLSGDTTMFVCGPPRGIHGVRQWIRDCILAFNSPHIPASSANPESPEAVLQQLEDRQILVFDHWNSNNF